MSDSPNIIISEISAQKLRERLIGIRKWYADYKGEKTVKLVKADDELGVPISYTTVEKLETILDSGDFAEWQQQFLQTKEQVLAQSKQGFVAPLTRGQRREQDRKAAKGKTQNT